MTNKEEQQFSEWCLEAIEYGIIDSYEIKPEKICIFPKTIIDEFGNENIIEFKPVNYNPDFCLKISSDKIKVLSETGFLPSPYNTLQVNNKSYYIIFIDTKGTWAPRDRKSLYETKKSVLFHELDSVINTVVLPDFFLKTFSPKCTWYSPKKKEKTKYHPDNGCRSAEDFAAFIFEGNSSCGNSEPIEDNNDGTKPKM